MRRQTQIRQYAEKLWPLSVVFASLQWLRREWKQLLTATVRTAFALIVPAIQVIALLVAVLLLSVIIFFYLRSAWLPRTIIHEQIYFNYTKVPPQAEITLSTIKNQWLDVNQGSIFHFYNQSSTINRKMARFLYPGSVYTVDLTFLLSKSAKNYDTATSALQISMHDAYGGLTALSSRALIMPYQSPTSLYWESLYLLPWRMIGSVPIEEAVRIEVNAMNDFLEPTSVARATHGLRIAMDSPFMDVQSAHLSIMPKLHGITYYLYKHPILSFAVGVGLLFLFQTSIYCGIFVFIAIIWYAHRIYRNLDTPSSRTNEYEFDHVASPSPDSSSGFGVGGHISGAQSHGRDAIRANEARGATTATAAVAAATVFESSRQRQQHPSQRHLSAMRNADADANDSFDLDEAALEDINLARRHMLNDWRQQQELTQQRMQFQSDTEYLSDDFVSPDSGLYESSLSIDRSGTFRTGSTMAAVLTQQQRKQSDGTALASSQVATESTDDTNSTSSSDTSTDSSYEVVYEIVSPDSSVHGISIFNIFSFFFGKRKSD